ncbi:nuclear transport factor 2 family protein [Pseudarthrobacter sp. IC2-21]|uniref:nuclear transport factor 2 family protein n=1 Tax=Pseudarthrobacter sp. IC2-21 TaxID=3092262 RepID=UPI002A69D7D1|nr:nuclear transport factor 2 family protein [Pseudarthrobacter sp. IC2-21]
MTTSATEVVEQYIRAYNDFDFSQLESLLAEDVYLTHHNRGFVTEGREATMNLYKGTPDLIPDRALVERTGLIADGDRVVVQHTLTGTNKVDTPFGPAGASIRIDLATVFTVVDGKVTKYEDYG